MKIHRLIGILIGLVILCGLFCMNASAAVMTYSSTGRKVNVGIVLLRNQKGIIANTDPYVFYIMDMRTDIKPAGWEFVNPLAPKFVTSEITNRSGVYKSYSVGQAVGKNMAPYWEVDLANTSLSSLQKFDILLIHGTVSNTSFSASDREKLREYTDSGGLLWIDGGTAGFSIDTSNPLFMDVQFGSGNSGSTAKAPSGGRFSSLISSPNWLTDTEIAQIGSGDGVSAGACLSSISAGKGSAPKDMMGVVTRGGQPVVAIAQYGAGVVVATAGDVCSAINDNVGDYSTYGWNAGPYCGDKIQYSEAEDLKLAYNIAGRGTGSPMEMMNSRHTGVNGEEIGSSLREKWEYSVNAPSSVSSELPVVVTGNPAIYNGIAYVPGSDGTLYAFSCDPRSDIASGTVDTGVARSGYEPNLLWKKSLADNGYYLGSPIVAQVPDSEGSIIPIVYAYTFGGGTFSSKLFALDAISGDQIASPLEISGLEVWSPPVYVPPTSELVSSNGGSADCGTLFLTATHAYPADYSVLLRVDAGSLQFREDCASTGEGKTTGSVFGFSPSIARLHDETSGATDLTAIINSEFPATSGNGDCRAFTYAVSNETLTADPRNDSSSSNYLYYTRFASSPVIMRIGHYSDGTPMLRLHYTDSNGKSAVWDPKNGKGNSGDVKINQDLSGNFAASKIVISSSLNIQLGSQIYADYSLDTRADSSHSASDFKPSMVSLMDSPNGNQRFYGSGASSIGPDGTCYYGSTDGWFIKGTSMIQIDPAGSVFALTYGMGGSPQVKWKVNLNSYVGTDVSAYGTPIILDGVSYCAAVGSNASYLVAFNNNMSFRYRESDTSTNALVAPVTINQIDPVRDNVTNTPGAQDYVVDYANGEIIVKNFRNLDTMAGFEVVDANGSHNFNLVNSGKGFVSKINVSSGNEKIISQPILVGNKLFVVTGNGDTAQLKGYTLDGLTINSFTSVSFALNKAGSLFQVGLACANGIISVNGPDRIIAFYSPTTLIADGNRLIEVNDPSSSDSPAIATWQCNSTYKIIPKKTYSSSSGVAAAVSTTSLSKPTSVRKLSKSDFLVTDSGNDRVIEIDRSGRESMEIKDFTDPLGILPPDQPLKLQKPTDAIRYYTFENSGKTVVPHTIIVDSGNNRIVSVRTLAVPGQGWTATSHALDWVSKSITDGVRYDYHGIELVPLLNGMGLLCGINNASLDFTGNLVGSGGTLAILDYTPATSSSSSNGAGYRGGILQAYNQAVASDGSIYPLSNISSIQRYVINNSSADQGEHILLSDGIRIIDTRLDPSNKRLVLWYQFPAAAAPLGNYSPTYAKRLQNGDVIVVSSDNRILRIPPTGDAELIAGRIQVKNIVSSTAADSKDFDYLLQPYFVDGDF